MIHQHPEKVMRYFKWGVARLILEAEPCPDVLPMWIDGLQEVMSERRTWPRPIPRPGKDVSVTFGDLVDREKVFGGFRSRWKEMKARAQRKHFHDGSKMTDELGVVVDDHLKYSAEAEQLRVEVTLAVRREVLRVRRSKGLPDEDPKRELANTFRREGSKREGEMNDRSMVNDT
jgi:monolysocardiolipin acyltransferase